MATVVRRTFRSTPHRDAHATWLAIAELLTRGGMGPVHSELLSIAGIAASVIADQVPREAAILITCDGPQTRIYCLYDEDAVDGESAKEDALVFDPLKGEWRISLPCPADDLSWVTAALKKHSSRITARDSAATTTQPDAEPKAVAPTALVFDPKGFLGQ